MQFPKLFLCEWQENCLQMIPCWFNLPLSQCTLNKKIIESTHILNYVQDTTLSQIYPHSNWNSTLTSKLRLEFQFEYRFKLEFQVEWLMRWESVCSEKKLWFRIYLILNSNVTFWIKLINDYKAIDRFLHLTC